MLWARRALRALNGRSLALGGRAEQKVLGPDVMMVHRQCFLPVQARVLPFLAD